MTNDAPKKGPRGETTTRGGRNTRQLILDAAAEIMCRDGYAGTKLSDIAEIAGIKTPAIYRHFHSRDDLVDAVMTVGHQRFIEHVTSVIDALPPNATPLDRILAAVAGHLEVALTMSHYAAASTRNMNQMPDDIRIKQQELRREYGAIWRRHLSEAAEAGQLHPDLNLYAAQGLIIGALSWSNEWWDPERQTLKPLIRNAQALVRQGLGR
ncbi:TetR/AcrR family transcriptional regulator [Rhodococcus sp. IEGM 1366]|uniref:TetR/AcrR family transcriptional regulator n=1 Tax=Rhodococcus sp. IEGM 1366 TaxID=3082223 RepID=UPI002955C75E|nr:TetR/AcrR family transcriptional regulator [Rhodococcus sp. IEGM 1366]MDV8070902.1 TetR/AcrR family transcriptional regulator [Rhodococcus sp. IEGM 1366]